MFLGNLCSFSPPGNKFDPATLIHMKVTFANVHYSQANLALMGQTVSPLFILQNSCTSLSEDKKMNQFT